MRLLLDTHIFLWYITGDPRLPVSVVKLALLPPLHRDPFDKTFRAVCDSLRFER